MNEPKLRFKADDGSQFPDWEEKELGQILTEDLYPVENPDGAYTKLAIRSHGKGTFDRHVEAGESLDVDKMFEVKANRLILNITFAWELAIAITTKEDEGKLVSHRFPQYMISGNVDFYKYRLINERMRYDLGVASPGGAGRNRVLNKSAFLKIRKYIPSLPEQQKIAEFLSTVDTVIEKQKETVSAWEERKKGVMQKLFGQEVRFKADDGSDFPEWEEKKIRDITLSHNAGVYIAKDNYGTGTNIIGVGDIYESDVINGKQYRLAPVDSDEYILDEGDLVYGESSLVPEGIARTVCVGAAGKGTAFAWHTRRYKVDRTIINPYFLTLQVNYAERVRNHLMRVCTRNALTGMTTNEYFGTKVSVPCLAEQQKIVDCLSALDEVIEKQKATLAAWEELKKGLLQQMFV